MADKKISYKENYLIMFGHMADDMCQGALPAILTFMYQEGKLNSYADIAYLITATTIINAIAQPITGYLSDKKPRPYIMTVGMLIAALGIMFLGFMDSMLFMIIAVAVNGLGVAIFHPSAGKLANVFAGKNVGKGMSIFSVGGNIGYAIGPVFFTLFYSFMGLSASVMIMLPAAIMAIIFSMRSRRYNVYSRKAEIRRINKIKSGDARENYAGTFILLLLVFARSAAMFSLTTFLPLYFISILDVSDKISTISVTIFAMAGAIATFFGGPLADRFGFTQLVRMSSFLAIPFAFIFIYTHNIYAALLMLIPLSVFYYAGMSPIVVIGQKLLCNHVGMATGLTIGLGISFGGIIAPVIGSIGDNYGIWYAMLTVAFILVIAALTSLLVPIVNKRQTKAS